MRTSPTPPVTVLICTRDRGDSIATTIRSVLACPYPDLRLVIVDQSDDLRTARAIGAFAGDPRLRYISTSARGKSRAENLALAVMRSEFVLLTDDDCEVPPNWVDEMLKPFHAHPRVGVVFCDVLPAPHDAAAGFVPDSLSQRSFLVESLDRWQTCDGLNIGVGAGMAIRHSAAAAIGGFSLLFGPGSPFRSGDDTDFVLRALAAGYQVYRTNTVGVTHYGFRTYAQARTLIRNNLFGLGGMYGQLLRRGHPVALRRYAAVVWVMAIGPTLDAILHLRPPRVIGRFYWLLRGMLKGLLTDPARASAD